MKWNSEAEKRDLVRHRRGGRGWSEVAIALNGKFGNQRTADACSGKYRRMQVSGEPYQFTVADTHEEPTYDELVAAWNRWIGRTPTEIEPPTTEDGNRRRIGIICDTHAPYENRAVVRAFAQDGPYDIVIHGGDLLDYESVSSFTHDRGSTMREEVRHGTWLLEVLAGVAKEVVVTTDNHGKRILKMLSKANLPPELLEILGWLAPNLDLFNIMADGLDNVTIATHDEPACDGSPVTLSFLVQRGDLIVGHPDTSSKIPLRAVHNFDDWLIEWKDVLRLKPWRVIGMGHTHQLGISYERGGEKVYMETGSAITIEGMQYALVGKIGYRPPVPAYTVLEQYLTEDGEWRTNINSIKQTIVKEVKQNERDKEVVHE